MALLLVVSWRPAASYQIPLELVVCWGALVRVLALFFIKREWRHTMTSITESNPARRVIVKGVAV